MDATGMMLASGGVLSMLIGLLMALLPLILLVIAWRILKWSSSTAQQVTRLTEQMDELLQQLQNGIPVAATAGGTFDANPSAPATARSAADEDDDFDILATAPAAAVATAGMSPAMADASATATDSWDDQSAADEADFEFPAAEADLLGDDEPQATEPAADFADRTDAEPAEPFAASTDFDFGMDETEPGGETFADQPEDASTTEAEDDFFSRAEADANDDEEFGMAGTFADADPLDDFDAAPGTDVDTPSDAASTEDQDEQRLQESFDSAFPSTVGTTAEPPAETELPAEPEPVATEAAPAIVPLEDDPARPEVSLARCGQCDHKLAYKKTLAGKKARCPSCKGAFVLP